MKDNPKVSIVTVVWNNKDTVVDAIDSVLSQDYNNVEYIVIDGQSTDGTVDVIKSYGNRISTFVSEPDKGLYDALNKGISLATGDIVGLLHSDDFYIDNSVISDIVKEFIEKDVDSIYADLLFVKADNLSKTVRYYDSSSFHPNKFAYGWMPAHPTFFAKKEIYEKHGVFKTDYKIAADYDLLVRFLFKNSISYSYIKKPIIKMRVGGLSTSGIKSKIILNREIIRACKENGIKTNWVKILSKYPKKILELIKK